MITSHSIQTEPLNRSSNPDILLVDDNAALRDATAEMLRSTGKIVETATDGETALLLGVTPRVLITDLRMPGIDGFELARRMRTRRPKTAVLFVSSHFDQIPDLPGTAPSAYLTKPLDAAKIMELVESWLDAEPSATVQNDAKPDDTVLGDTVPESGALAATPRSLEPRIPPRRGPAAARIAALMAGAMLVAVVMAVGLHLFRLQEPPLPDLDQGPVRSAFIAIVEPEGPIARAPSQLVWQNVEHATIYRLRLEAVDGRELWNSTTTTPSIELETAIRHQLLANVAYFWHVEALDPEGNLLATSPLTRFRIIEPTTP